MSENEREILFETFCSEQSFKLSANTQFMPKLHIVYTVEPPNNGHVGDEHFVHCSEVVPSSEVEMYGQYIGRGQTVCPL